MTIEFKPTTNKPIITTSLIPVSTEIHWSKQLNNQPVLLLSSSVHNCSINEHKNMKLRENICFEIIN